MRKFLSTLAFLAFLAAPVQAQLGSVPYTFSPNTTIVSAEVNTNFSTIYSNALDRTGGTMSGDLTTQDILAATHNTYDIGSTGTRFQDLFLEGNIDADGTLNVEGAVTLQSTLSAQATTVTTIDSGNGATEIYDMDQDIASTDAVTFLTVNTGQGANELYDMDQNVLTTSAVTFTTVNTGQGANELYDMNQNVQTTSDVAFNSLGVGGSVSTDSTVAITNGPDSPSAAAFMLTMAGSVAVPAGTPGGVVSSAGTLVEAASGTHGLLSGLRVTAPVITDNAASVTNTATVYISGAPSTTVSGANYALWVDAGNVQIDGDLTVGGTISGGSGASTGYALQANVGSAAGNTIDPADSTAYYIGTGREGLSGLSVAADHKVYIPKAGTITTAYFTVRNEGTLGTSETSTVAIRLNNTTDTSVSTAVQADSAIETFSNTGLSISVAQGDYIEFKWTTPAWSTNPTDLDLSWVVFVEE